jgi:TolB protein
LVVALTIGWLLVLGGALLAEDGARILFVSERDGNPEIYVMNADGSSQTRITDHPADDRDPSWAPDRTRFVFASDRDGDFDLYTMGLDGSGLTAITDTEKDEAWPVWSPDGKRIAFIRGRVADSWYIEDAIFVIMDDPQLFVLDLATGVETQLGSSVRSLYAPTWSPDGTSLAYHEMRDDTSGGYALTFISIKVIVLASEKVTTIAQSTVTGTRFYFYSHPAWSPDGERIAVEYGESQMVTRRITRSLSTIDTDGGGRDSHARGDVEHAPTEPSWSPDGLSIAYTLGSAYDLPAYIYVVGTDGSAPTKITTSGLDYAPAWGD